MIYSTSSTASRHRNLYFLYNKIHLLMLYLKPFYYFERWCSQVYLQFSCHDHRLEDEMAWCYFRTDKPPISFWFCAGRTSSAKICTWFWLTVCKHFVDFSAPINGTLLSPWYSIWNDFSMRKPVHHKNEGSKVCM